MNTATAADVAPLAGVPDPDVLRASSWRLLGFLLSGPPPQALLDRMAAEIEPGPGGRAVEQAWQALADAAGAHDAAQWEREYNALFIGIGEGELMPYGSWYLTGRVMDKPLAKLRGALRMLGIERQPEAGEPEDHAAAVCEVLALLAEDADVAIEAQREFFQAHVRPWLPRFFDDLHQAPSARAYRSVGALGAAVVALDDQYLSMLA